MIGLAILEEVVEQFDEVVGAGDVFVEALADSVLKEQSARRGLEDDVVGGVAGGDFLFDFFFEVVVLVFGFPEAAAEFEVVEECAVDFEGMRFGPRDGEFGDEGPVELAAAFGEQVLEGAAHGHFVIEVQLAELAEGFVVGLDGGVRRLQVQLLHG